MRLFFLSSLRAKRSNPELQYGLPRRYAPRNDKITLSFFMSLLFILIVPLTAYPQSNQPVEITAQTHLEWNRTDQTFVAIGDAKAIQGDTTINAATLRANFTQGANGKGMDVNELSAIGGVVITSEQNTLYGDHATYDVTKAYARMTGENLRMTAPDQTITARDRFEYWTEEGRIEAIGNVIVTRPKPDQSGIDTLKANQITALLKNNAQGKRSIDTIEAKGNVIITTPLETVTGAYGIYRSLSNTIELTGGVKITRGQNTLQGDRATVNLNTNVSKIFGGAAGTSDGRVKGVFFPGSRN